MNYKPECKKVKIMNLIFKYNNKQMTRCPTQKISYKYLKILKLFITKYKYEIGGEIKFENDNSVNHLTLQTSFEKDQVKINLNKQIIYHTHVDITGCLKNYKNFFRACYYLFNKKNLDIIKNKSHLSKEYNRIIKMSNCMSQIFIKYINVILQDKCDVSYIKKNKNYLINVPDPVLKKIMRWMITTNGNKNDEKIRQQILVSIFNTCPLIENVYSPPSGNDILIICKGAVNNSFFESPNNVLVSIVVTRKGIFKMTYELNDFIKINKKIYDDSNNLGVEKSKKYIILSIKSKIKNIEQQNINYILSGLKDPSYYFKKIYKSVGIKIVFKDWNYIKSSGLSLQ